MSASFLLLRNNFPTSQQQNGNTECGACLSYDTQTCCLIILPTVAAAAFFVWLFFQKGHLAVGLVLGQLLAIVILGILAFLLGVGMHRCWRNLLKYHMRTAKPKYSTTTVGEQPTTGGEPQLQQVQI